MTFDLQNPSPNSGDELRDEAANLLSSKYGPVTREQRVCGKKVDIYFASDHFGRQTKTFVEAKDYNRPLRRDEVAGIWTDYSGIIDRNKPATLLIITRNGLTADAEAFISQEQSQVRHNTIWQLEDDILGITEYVRSLVSSFDEDGLRHYYIPGKARSVEYDDDYSRSTSRTSHSIFDKVQSWLETAQVSPFAILGGYGAGKTSLTKRLVSFQAERALSEPSARRPVLIKLGAFSRYSNIEGILGAMFTHEFPVHSFSVRRFLDLNDSGRLFIILDGFDEMKHAMSWSDFRVQVSELRKLMTGDARVLLLGRPSAFMSQEEHLQVLRGRRKAGEEWYKIPDWPEFIEYEMDPFDNEDRDEFIRRYLFYKHDVKEDSGWINNRADEVSNLASMDPEIFSKPVHAKILTDLALDKNVDLARFQDGVSRWQLYELFFDTLAERESMKEARRAIPDEARLKFLREIAYWLWSEKQGATSFSGSDLPERILRDLPQGDASDVDSKRREYLSGSFLEKKAGDIFYFGHRSFAEFLVAQRMALSPPSGETHSEYSALVRDGVATFLGEAPRSAKVGEWPSTLDSARGKICFEYLAFLSDVVGGKESLSSLLLENSPIKSVLQAFEGEFIVDEKLIGRLISALRTHSNEHFAVLYSALSIYWDWTDTHGRLKKFAPRIVAAIFDRLFDNAEFVEGKNPNYRINKQFFDTKKLAVAAIGSVLIRRERYIPFRWNNLANELENILTAVGYSFQLRGSEINDLLRVRDIELPLDEVLQYMKQSNRAKVKDYYKHHSSLSSILVPGVRAN